MMLSSQLIGIEMSTGEYYIDEYGFDRMGKGIKIESGFYSGTSLRH